MVDNSNMKCRSRGWCLTVNNYTDQDFKDFFEVKAAYAVVGREIGKKDNTKHLQGYLYFKNKKSFKQIKNMFKTAHIEIAKGSPVQNRDYCIKDGDYQQEGELPVQGKRTDIEEIKAIVANEPRPMGIVCEMATNLQQIKIAEKLLTYTERVRAWKPYVKWYWGVSGAGKTRKAVEELADPWISAKNLKWWDGYDGHENIIIDDFRRDFCTFHELLRILDRYAYRIEVKGGSRQLLARNIIVTSAYSPEKVYETREDLQQLLRRIDEVIEFKISDLEND